MQVGASAAGARLAAVRRHPDRARRADCASPRLAKVIAGDGVRDTIVMVTAELTKSE
jgi:hypothetical protein